MVCEHHPPIAALAVLDNHFVPQNRLRSVTSLSKSVKLGKYKHLKENIYEAINITQHTETDEQLVIYKNETNNVFARPMDMSTSKVDRNRNPTAVQEYRFEFIKGGE